MLNNIEISKELLSEVLNHTVILEIDIDLEDSKVGYLLDNKNWYFINIYELSHKCKEWAFKQGYSYLGNKGLINIYSKTETLGVIMDKNVVNWFDVYIDFKACEWILKEVNK